MGDLESAILEACENVPAQLFAWCILPNHYHLCVRTADIKILRQEIGKVHGRTARFWNVEDGMPARKVWFNFFDRDMKSERHYWATINYIHHNPIRHGYVARWQDWPFSSARKYLQEVGSEEAARTWLEYPILDYGKGWDDF